MPHPRLPHRLLLSALPLVLSFSVLAAEPKAAPTTNQATNQATRQTMDLRAPAINKVMTQAEIDDVLAKTVEPDNLEGVQVDRSRMNDPNSPDYIPPGFASLFWAAGRPSGLWRLFTPRLTTRSRDNINPTNPAQPAPGIPPMAGEVRPFDR